jgi:hypothetical protein
MKEHENILVFGKGTTIYNPIKEERKGSGKQRQKAGYANSKATAKTGSLLVVLWMQPKEQMITMN